jgi:hypothetical protein
LGRVTDPDLGRRGGGEPAAVHFLRSGVHRPPDHHAPGPR